MTDRVAITHSLKKAHYKSRKASTQHLVLTKRNTGIGEIIIEGSCLHSMGNDHFKCIFKMFQCLSWGQFPLCYEWAVLHLGSFIWSCQDSHLMEVGDKILQEPHPMEIFYRLSLKQNIVIYHSFWSGIHCLVTAFPHLQIQCHWQRGNVKVAHNCKPKLWQVLNRGEYEMMYLLGRPIYFMLMVLQSRAVFNKWTFNLSANSKLKSDSCTSPWPLVKSPWARYSLWVGVGQPPCDQPCRPRLSFPLVHFCAHGLWGGSYSSSERICCFSLPLPICSQSFPVLMKTGGSRSGRLLLPMPETPGTASSSAPEFSGCSRADMPSLSDGPSSNSSTSSEQGPWHLCCHQNCWVIRKSIILRCQKISGMLCLKMDL